MLTSFICSLAPASVLCISRENAILPKHLTGEGAKRLKSPLAGGRMPFPVFLGPAGPDDKPLCFFARTAQIWQFEHLTGAGRRGSFMKDVASQKHTEGNGPGK
jgi:hypothetical protein